MGYPGTEPTAPDGAYALAYSWPGDADPASQSNVHTAASAAHVDASSIPAHFDLLTHDNISAERHAATVSYGCCQHTYLQRSGAHRADGDKGHPAYGHIPLHALFLSDPEQAYGDVHDSSSTDPYISGTDVHTPASSGHSHVDVGQRTGRDPSFYRFL